MAQISGRRDATNALYCGMDEMYTAVFKCPECGENDAWSGFKFCPMCGEPIEWVE